MNESIFTQKRLFSASILSIVSLLFLGNLILQTIQLYIFVRCLMGSTDQAIQVVSTSEFHEY